MSKEVLFAGILAVACLVLVGIAFLAPHKPARPVETVTTETTQTVSPEADTAGGTTAGATSGSATSALIAQGTTGGSTTAAGFTSATGSTGGYTTGGYSSGGTTTASGFTTGGTTTAGGFTSGATTSGGYTAGATTSSGFTAGGTTVSSLTGGRTTAGGTGTFTTGGGTFTTTGGTTGSFTGGATTGSSTGGSTTTTITASEKTHVVAANETLAEISQKYYNTSKHWKKIAEANHVDPNALKVGQKLIIPALSPDSGSTSSTTTVTAGPGERTYTVQKGDSYYSIAQKELGAASRWKEIQKLNGIGPEELRVGQTIKLPSKDAAPSAPRGAADSTPAGARVHVVAAGETLSDIAAKELGTSTRWKEILKANPGVDPDALKVGQKLAIPDGGAAKPSTTTGGGAGASEYTVKAGDTSLQVIAEKVLGSKNAWRRIADANPGIDPKHLRIGQVLKIPGRRSDTASDDDTRPSTITGGASTAGGSTFGSTSGGSTFGSTSGGSTFTTGGSTTSGAGGGTSFGGGSGFGTTPAPRASGTTAGATTSGGFTATTGGTAGHVGPP